MIRRKGKVGKSAMVNAYYVQTMVRNLPPKSKNMVSLPDVLLKMNL